MKYLIVTLAALVALPAMAQGNNPRPGQSSSPAPASNDSTPPDGWLGAGQPVPDELTQYQADAQPYCIPLDANSTSEETSGFFTCQCAVSMITQQAWSDYDYSNSGPFMSPADAKLIADTVKTASNMAEAGSTIYNNLSADGESVLSACYSK